MQNKVEVQRKRLHRIKASNAALARELLVMASILTEGEGSTQRQIFKELMPMIYLFKRKEGFTFKIITSMLCQLGLKLTESSVRVYFFDFIQKHEDEYIREVNIQAPMFDEVMKEIRGVDFNEIPSLVTRIMARHREYHE